MSQIEINILKESSAPNIISCSFFTMKDSYRTFEKYQTNLKNFLSYTKKLSNFEVRIYTDNTGKDYALKISQDNPQVSIYHFNCPEFRDGDGHIGTFGTLVRFLPLFEQHSTVWISDIDIPEYWINKTSEADIEGYTMLCYDRKVYARKYTLGAGRFISHVQFPRALLTRFITKIIKGEFNSTIDALNKQNKRKPQSKFPYGMDEVFLNSSIYNSIKKHSLNVNILIDYIPSLITHAVGLSEQEVGLIQTYYKTADRSLVTKLKDIFRKKIPTILDKYPCLNPLMQELDTLKHFTKHVELKSHDL